MTRTELTLFTEKFILPIFPGSRIQVEDNYKELSRVYVGQPSKRDDDVEGTSPGPLYLVIQYEYNSPSQNRILLYRSQMFTELERDFIRKIFELAREYYIAHHEINLYEEIIVNRAVADVTIPSNTLIIQILNYYEMLANRTYEGNKIAYSILVDNERVGNTNLVFSNLNENDFMMVLTNSINTYFCLDLNGNVIEYKKSDIIGQSKNSPIVFEQLAGISKDGKIGIALILNGDILIFKDRSLLFAKRRGRWLIFSHDQIITQMGCGASGRWSAQIRKSVYETAIDVSFMHTGGLICLAESSANDRYNEKTFEKYLFSTNEQGKCQKAKVFSSIIGQKFHELDRYIRKEICSVDGAVLLKSSGDIVAIGAIVKNPSESDQGARTAAAMSLSELGLAIKISTDGMIKGYYHTPHDNTPKFSIG